MALLHAIQVLDELKPANDDQKVGIDIIRRALQAPVRQIAENAGTDGAVVAGKLLDKDDANYGFDAQSGEYVDMVKAGIIDPTKVVRIGAAGCGFRGRLLITTEAMIAERRRRRLPAACRWRRRRHGRHGRRHGFLIRSRFVTDLLLVGLGPCRKARPLPFWAGPAPSD